MAYQVLARKWRPKTFSQLVGQQHVVRALTNALSQQRLHHAYLFTGTRGVGKTTIARILAKALNCETGVTATPCGTCAACREIDGARFVDLLELDAASNTQVDNMRELLDNAQYAPTSGRFKVYIIDEVHMLSRSAFNAMLKTLEEPPEHVKFVLATTDPQKIPVTVLSRCLQFNLKQLPPGEIATHLETVIGEESLAAEQAALQMLARAAQGSMRDALSLLDQAIAYSGGAVNEDVVASMLGAIDQSFLYRIVEGLIQKDGRRILAEAEAMAARSIDFDAALQDLGTVFHHIALAQAVPEALPEDLPHRAQILQFAQQLDPETVQLNYQIALHGRKDLPLAPDVFAGFTMALLRMLAFAPDSGQSEGSTMETGGSGVSSRPNAAGVDRGSERSASVAQEPPVAYETRFSHETPLDRERAGSDQPPQTDAGAQSDRRPGSGGAQGAPHGQNSPTLAFSGDWPELVARLKLGGMARMLAQHCELRRFDGDTLELCVPEAHKHLMERSYQDRLRQAIEEQLSGLSVTFCIGEVSGMTPAEVTNRAKQARQADAIAAIEQDPFVRDLVEQFDAKVVESSIRPVDGQS